MGTRPGIPELVRNGWLVVAFGALSCAGGPGMTGAHSENAPLPVASSGTADLQLDRPGPQALGLEDLDSDSNGFDPEIWIDRVPAMAAEPRLSSAASYAPSNARLHHLTHRTACERGPPHC